MKAYLAQLPPLAWVGLLIPVLLVAYQVLTTVAMEIARGAVLESISNFLRLL